MQYGFATVVNARGCIPAAAAALRKEASAEVETESETETEADAVSDLASPGNGA